MTGGAAGCVMGRESCVGAARRARQLPALCGCPAMCMVELLCSFVRPWDVYAILRMQCVGLSDHCCISLCDCEPEVEVQPLAGEGA